MTRQSGSEDADQQRRQQQQSGDLHRRTFLRTAGVSAALGSGIGLAGGLLHSQRAAAAATRDTGAAAPRAGRAAGALASGSVPPVLLGGAEVRPPSVPLAVRSPYLSAWLPATDLTSVVPQFWFGSNVGFAGLARIDGQVFAWAGQPQVSSATATPMTQTALNVTATRSVFTLNAGGVELTAEWLSPIEPGDLRRESVPFTLLTVQVRGIDQKPHDVQVYADITGEWASSDESGVITWNAVTTGRNRYWSVQLQNPDPLTENAQMANWGSAIWGSPLAANQTYQSGYAADVRNQFASAGSLADTNDTSFRAINDNQPVFAFASDLGTVAAGSGRPVSFAIGHVRTPLISYGPDATPILPWWTRHWADWTQMADFFLADAPAARIRAAALDQRIEGAATHAAGPGYSAVCALAARQCYGGMEVAIGPQGGPWVLGKEISSDGDTNSVDIFDQAYLMWLSLDPQFIPLEMEPILTWCASPGWQDESLWTSIPSWETSQTRYCVHDLGVYPKAAGRAPGNGEQMPIEESAGMLIMAASYARRVGAPVARPFLQRWTALWTQWAQYLLTQVPTPATQLGTDDWVATFRTPTGSVNLGIKAIIGLAAAGQIATILGDQANAATWSQAARDNVATWAALSLDPSGDYLDLEQGAPGTWSTIYNAFYEVVIGETLVPDDIKALQSSFYLTKLNAYGLPLEVDEPQLSKVAWNLYIPAWLRDYPIATEMLNRDVAYINDTPSLVPYGDRYNTATAVEVTGVKAHPTLGAVFAVLFAAEPPAATTATPGALVVSAALPATVTMVNTGTSQNPVTVDWTAAPSAGSGITVSPASGSATLPPGRPTRTTLAVTASATAAPATVTVPIAVTAHGGAQALLSPGSYFQVSIPYPSLAAAFDNVGITDDDADHSAGDFDGSGNTWSAAALADVGITPGGQITAAGVTFTWPDVPSGQQDNVVASGQTIAVPGAGSTLGLLGAATTGIASGAATITYTDQSTQTFVLQYQDWINTAPAGGDVLVATTSYFNRTSPGAARTPSLFAATVPLQSGKTIAAITLPDVSGTPVTSGTTSMHIFAIAIA